MVNKEIVRSTHPQDVLVKQIMQASRENDEFATSWVKSFSESVSRYLQDSHEAFLPAKTRRGIENDSPELTKQSAQYIFLFAAEGESTSLAFLQGYGYHYLQVERPEPVAPSIMQGAKKLYDMTLSEFITLEINKKDFFETNPLHSLVYYTQKLLYPKPLVSAFDQAAQNNEVGLEIIYSLAEKSALQLLAKENSLYLADEIKQKIKRDIPGWIEEKSGSSSIDAITLRNSIMGYGRLAAHNFLEDISNKYKRKDQFIDPKPVHNIQDFLTDFPDRTESSSPKEYRERLREFMEKNRISTGLHNSRVILLDLALQGKGFEDMAQEASNFFKNAYSVEKVFYILRSDFTKLLQQNGLYTFHYYQENFQKEDEEVSSIDTSQKITALTKNRIYAAVLAEKVEVLKFLNLSYFKRNWIREYVKDKRKRRKRR